MASSTAMSCRSHEPDRLFLHGNLTMGMSSYEIFTRSTTDLTFTPCGNLPLPITQTAICAREAA
eukprot:scaffold119413_cov74-Phaeocystis_antarctica.AAC.6